MLVSDLPPVWRASVRHHKAVSLFINLLGVVMNFIWRIARALKGHCLHFCFLYRFISPSNPPPFHFNLCITQKLNIQLLPHLFFVTQAEKSLRFSPLLWVTTIIHQISGSREKIPMYLSRCYLKSLYFFTWTFQIVAFGTASMFWRHVSAVMQKTHICLIQPQHQWEIVLPKQWQVPKNKKALSWSEEVTWRSYGGTNYMEMRPIKGSTKHQTWTEEITDGFRPKVNVIVFLKPWSSSSFDIELSYTTTIFSVSISTTKLLNLFP